MKKTSTDIHINVFSEEALDLFSFDLQLFAAEDEGRTEEPTEKKIRDAREKGQVAKTPELAQALVVIFGFLVLFFLGKWIFGQVARLLTFYFSHLSQLTLSGKGLMMEGTRTLEILAKVLLPIFAAVMVAAFLGEVAQVGFQISSHPLKIDFSKIKLTPADMMKKIFFSRQVGMNLVKSIFKVVVIGVVAYLIISSDFDEVLKTPDLSLIKALTSIALIALKIILWSAVLLMLLAIPDYIFQRQELLESLKMTKQEVKEELKESMGDPHMRARLREMQRDILTRNMIREVPKADVIVTNPTHFAVALRWESATMEAPMIIAKGLDSMALKIREIAKSNNIMIIENRPLAQEMYKRLEIGDVIPEDLFKAISEVYTMLYQAGKLQEAI